MRSGDARPAARPAGASWFGPLEGGAGPGEDDAAASRYDRGGWRDSQPDDSRFLSRQARRMASSDESGVQRLYRAFVAARAALGVALLTTELLITWLAVRPERDAVLALSAGYAGAALALWLVPGLLGARLAAATRLRRRQWLATIGIDLLLFGALHLVGEGDGLTLNYSALLVLPVLMAGVLTPRMQALGVAAAATLVLLSATLLGIGPGGSTPLLLTQAGLAGSGLFVVSLIASEVSGRLAREERTARGSLALARRQAELNRLVLDEMQDGVLVVDRRGRARAANPAARRLLGQTQAAGGEGFALTGVAAWEPLVRAVDRAFAEGSWPEAGRDVALAGMEGRPGQPLVLRLRVRFTQRRSEVAAPEHYCVLFIEDLRSVQARTRQEKLAAMGRVSAGIAHEIRNPLAAIMQANGLLAEDAASPEQRQLMRIVGENAERLKRIVDDMMEFAPGPAAQSAPIDAGAQVATVCSEWARTVQLPGGAASPLVVSLPGEPLGVLFDAEHLRRVLVNLLDNALRHSKGGAGAVQVRLDAASATQVVLAVASDGEPIAAEVERHLFEPFFSTRSRGTGLGLYICRELCERYGASIDYVARARPARHRNEFSVAMRRALLPQGESRLHFSA